MNGSNSYRNRNFQTNNLKKFEKIQGNIPTFETSGWPMPKKLLNMMNRGIRYDNLRMDNDLEQLY